MSQLPDIPILPDIETELQYFATDLEKFSIYDYEKSQIHWQRDPDPLQLFDCEGSPLCTTLKVQRDPFTGKILDFHEVPLLDAGATAQNSMSFNRAPAPPSEATRGNASYIPFWPGSFPDPVLKLPDPEELLSAELLTVPPGFSTGLIFDTDGETVLNSNEENVYSKVSLPESKNVINLLELVHNEQNYLGTWNSPKKEVSLQSSTETFHSQKDEEDIIPKKNLVLEISKVSPPKFSMGTEWAIPLDTSKPVKKFNEKIPDMAFKWPFELDTFQKLAILQLEEHNHVFVAAHTSAGKTVVAEYAIALSQKHLTRTIYTSPIKALSNQKYRDFKKVFKDVGLITGDFQINPTAACLIMTTEILRSMLYCGSDITRDLEFVIFDEVHYINDRERGHVWEQALIMLPPHVCVVLLSATVPNVIEFADWLGRTHMRKVYVIKTLFRPVPLQHFLYTGAGGGTRDDRFLVLDVNNWNVEGYYQAKSKIPEQDLKVTNDRPRQFNDKQDKNLWRGLIDHLQRKDLLPVVAFTFSRAKCDRNATNLSSVDLTTQKEKSKIHSFFKKCIRNLKELDREIPQIKLMGDILTRGIGVHHSGVLPIIKEIVEMLFQNGLIKLLFATETFAMGVNMPARTVVFDSIQKHDGKCWRNLEPAEYIQMAGRAGRRGLDMKGTVIILCKNQFPSEAHLKEMMLGKPNLLESQFRLTYGMVLSLLRVENLSVEGMMQRSFREADHQKKLIELAKDLEEIEKEIEDISAHELSNHLQPLVKYFNSSRMYLKCREKIMGEVITSPKVAKLLLPGRILLISYKNHVNKLALLLAVTRSTKMFYKVLVLTDAEMESCDESDKTDLWYKMLSLAKDNVFIPSGTVGHDVLQISALDILEISSKNIKVNTELVLKDWNNRQLSRFRNDPPGTSCTMAIQELHKISLSANMSDGRTDYLHFVRDVKVDERNLYENLNFMYELKDKLIDHLPYTQTPNFVEQFSKVFARKYLEDKRDDFKFQLSTQSLSLYPDYENRIELLRKLKYVDLNNRVQLKGRVACEIGMNELLITELVLRNTFKELKPAEVAALLSSLVFRVRPRNEADIQSLLEDLSTTLKKAISELVVIHNEIINMETELGIRSEEIQEDLNFGLVFVVNEWASGKSFAEIMQHTDIQEGIIVRCIQQLNDTICDVRDAARIIGDPALQSKMEEASTVIKRDIVFAASLYTQGEAVTV